MPGYVEKPLLAPNRRGKTEVALPGRDFARQDYLGLARHPSVKAAKGTVAAVGELETRLRGFLGMESASVFASGEEAVRAGLAMALGPGDVVIIDHHAPPAMFEATRRAEAVPLRTPPGSAEAVERRLHRVRRERPDARVFVAVPTVSAQGSAIADLPTLSDLCQVYRARLIADVSHDIGAMGPTGRGVMEIEGCLGRVDIVIGSLAETFGADGGFVALREAGLLPVGGAPMRAKDAAAILAAFDMVDSARGRSHRKSLYSNSLRLRNHLMADGIRVMGQASPIVPIRLPVLTALPQTALLESAGVRIGLLQAPEVAGNAPRWLVRLTADHTAADIDDLAELIRDVTRVFSRRGARVDAREALSQE